MQVRSEAVRQVCQLPAVFQPYWRWETDLRPPSSIEQPLSPYCRMPSYASLTVLAFGATSFLTGAYALLSPDAVQSRLSLPPSSLPATRGNGLAAVAMGIYYTLAAAQENRAFFAATVPMRLLSAMVFWAQGGGWKAAGTWEGVGAALTGAAMLVE